MKIPFYKGILIRYLIGGLFLVISIPLFLRVVDLSRFVIFTTNVLAAFKGIITFYYIKSPLFLLSVLTLIIIILVFSLYQIFKRRLGYDPVFLSGIVFIVIEILPGFMMLIVKPELMLYYVLSFLALYLFIVLKKRPYDLLKGFALTNILLFPLFALLLLVGFNSSAARPRTTILNGGPSHNWYDEVCDRKRLLSQREISPIWIEDAWLYGGVATRDGRYFYFADNGYGIIGFEVQGNGEYQRLPSVRYPPDFNAALYSHRLYLTPDERYIYYFGARSAEFVFIERERLNVASVIPTQSGLDGFSATYDTRRDLIYGFPFIGKKIPVLYYNGGNAILTRWIDFSAVDGWVIQGLYNQRRDTLMIHTTNLFVEYSADSLVPLRSILIGPVATRSDYIEGRQTILFSNIFLRKIEIVDLESLTARSYHVPVGIRELFYTSYSDKMLLFDFSGSRILIMQDGNIQKEIYSGPRPRGMVILPSMQTIGGREKIIIGSGCGLFEVDINQK